jgi:hypothetical protein
VAARRRVSPPSRAAAGYALYRAFATSAAVRLVARERALVRLLRAHARDVDARRLVTPRRLAEDLVRVGALVAARRGRLPKETPRWDVAVAWEAGIGRLTFGSVPLDGARPPAVEDDSDAKRAARAALAAGEVTEIIWNHSAVGDNFGARVLGWVHSLLPVGYHLLPGAHSFGALVRLLPLRPELVIACFAPLLEPRTDAVAPVAEHAEAVHAR